MSTSVRVRTYESLPEAWIEDDMLLGQPLWSWLYYGLGDAEAIATFIERVARAELTDATLADTGWLPWLSQLIGVPFPDFFPATADVRTWMQRPNRMERGSHRSMAETVALQLSSGTPTVQVYGHWRTNPWIVVIRTQESETPLTLIPITTWDDLETVAPTWDDLVEEGTDDEMHFIDSIRVTIAKMWAAPEKMAGVRTSHRWSRQWSPDESDSFYQHGPDWIEL